MSSNEPGKIFVGGVSWDTKKEGLQAYFEKFGKVKDAVIMTDPVTDKPRGFGFVTFEDPSVVESVCSQEHILDAKKIDPKPATARPAPMATNARVKKVFIGGLAQGTLPEDLKQYFSQYGNVTEVDLKHDKDTNRMRGFGFVGFDSEDTVEKLVEIHYHTINGKSVEVKKAEANTTPIVRATPPANFSHQSYTGYGAGAATGGNQSFYGNYQQQGQQQAAAAAAAAAYGSNYGYGYGQGNFGTAQPTGYTAQTGYATQGTYSQAQAGYGQQPQTYGYDTTGSAYGKDGRQPSAQQPNYNAFSQANTSWYGYGTDTTGYANYQAQAASTSYNKGQQRYQPYSR